jgi:hypothetical protein
MTRRPLAATLLALILLALAVLHGPAGASEPDEPHPHQGLFAPITAAPAAAALSADEQELLDAGEVVLQQEQASKDAGWGLAVQYIEAPPSVVWHTILGYDQYPDRVGNVTSATIYKRDGVDLYLDMQCRTAGIRYGLYTINAVHRDEGWMAWTLDYSRKSDVYDMIGYWRVEELRADPPLTRLDYYTKMKIRGVPGWLLKNLTGSALEDGTAWVKKFSEQ